MLKFSEELLQFIWRHKLLKPLPFITTSGSVVSVLHPGELNHDAGPDFFNAQVRINSVVLAGNIEIHIKTSDWLKHKHQEDKNYNTVILHVVYEHDTDLAQNLEHQVEVLELKSLINEKTLEAYTALATAKAKLPCASQLKTVKEIRLLSWIERMAIERLEEKVKRLEHTFLSYQGDYTQTFYALVMRSFGSKVNALPFELLSRQLSVQVLLKHTDSLMQLEALLLGMAGLLEKQFEDKYIQSLQNEFEHLKNKYRLKPLQKEVFKFSRMRPANFPDIRLAQLANMLHKHKEIFTGPQTVKTYAAWLMALKTEPTGYWKNHYKPDGKASTHKLSFGKASAESVIINAVTPFFFFYAKKLSKPEYADVSITLLNQCKVEANAKTRLFEPRRGDFRNAASSQGIIHLYDNYCSSRKCLKCGIAAAILNPS